MRREIKSKSAIFPIVMPLPDPTMAGLKFLSDAPNPLFVPLFIQLVLFGKKRGLMLVKEPSWSFWLFCASRGCFSQLRYPQLSSQSLDLGLEI